MGTASLPGRHVLDISVVRSLSHRSDARGLLRFALHAACLAGTGTLVWLSRPWWYLLVPAMALHGFAIVTMFAPMHECIHRTAFKTRALNDVFGWMAGVLCFYNSTYYRRYHTWHHRYTQDTRARSGADDAQAAHRDRSTRYTSAAFRSGCTSRASWRSLAAGREQPLPFIPPEARWTTAASAAAQLAVYAAAICRLAGVSFDAGVVLLVPAGTVGAAAACGPS